MIQAGNKFDLIYVDGSHLIEDVFVDAYFAIRLLSNGGIVVFDDSSNQHVAKVLRFLRKTVPHLEEIDLSLYRQDRLAYRIGRLFGKVQLSAFRRVGNVERVWNAPYRSF